MGCCGSRVEALTYGKDKPFMKTHSSEALSCNQIMEIPNEVLDRNSYEAYSECSRVSLPFELVEINGKVYPTELKIALLLFSRDSHEEKLKLLEKILETDRKKLRFFEWRYQLINERIPKMLRKSKEIENGDHAIWVEKNRVAAGNDIYEGWNNVKNERFRPSVELLSV